MTDKQLLRMAEAGEREAAKLEERAAQLRDRAAKIRAMVGGTEAGLHKRLRSASVNVEMHTDHRVAISRSRKGDEAFLDAIGRYTQNELAKAVGISPATLSFYRNGRKIPRKTAEDIERLTGWKATGKNWPGGIKEPA